jgi:hypothetical protein
MPIIRMGFLGVKGKGNEEKATKRSDWPGGRIYSKIPILGRGIGEPLSLKI